VLTQAEELSGAKPAKTTGKAVNRAHAKAKKRASKKRR